MSEIDVSVNIPLGETVRLTTKNVPCVLTIAGSDSGGGAGIQADLKTFAALEVFGTCVITAITAQNTQGVYEILPVSPQTVERQIEAVLKDIPVKAAKTGMLYSGAIMEVVAEAINHHKLRVVVDPVFQAGTGDLLIHERDKETLIEKIVPQAFILTPNRFEAEEIAQMKIQNVEDMRRAAKRIAKLGAKAVVVKGGHLESAEATDVLYYEDEFTTFKKPRVKVNIHGGGCTFSAAITAYLALDHNVMEAVTKAEQFMQNTITFGWRIGGGRVPVNPMAHLYNEAEKFRVLENVSSAARMVEEHSEFLPYIAEVGTQVAMALPFASTPQEVAAVEGRILKFRDKAKATGSVQFGASSHVASIILTTMKHDPSYRASLNLHYDAELVKAFERTGFMVSSFDRKLEPSRVKTVEGGTLVWGVEKTIRNVGKIPDVIYDLGEIGKEPMIRVLGSSAICVVEKALASVLAVEKES
ncbi:MAG: bifunctional hydroxymethylpyrimidine kinase/phosphomethylpyrimidine kinase [Candidatus Bathyarchaeota archaeon]|nr:MAG: bifunctional hydroxymethylpyrimidine kinase/phosphomethylpyrimidine kinase [Candidatus Bathyarchaeota archaeon]